MNTLFMIAWRNVIRHGKRTLLTVITMSVGIAMFILMDSMMAGMDSGAIKNMAGLSESAMKVMTKAYREDARAFPLDAGIPDPASAEKAILSVPNVVAVVPRTAFLGELSNYEFSKPVAGTAIDPDRDASVFDLKEFVKGSWFGQKSENEIIVGYELANDLGLSIGSSIVLKARTKYDAENADEFTLVGIVVSSDPALNRNGVYVTYKAADILLDLEGTVTELDTKIKHSASTDRYLAETAVVTAAFTALRPDLAALSLAEQAKGFLLVSQTKKKGGYFLILVILVIAGIGIVNTVLMSVYSRLREIGVLRAFGLKKPDIRNLFLLEGGIMGTLGGIGGVILGVAMDWLLVNFGISIEAMAGKIDAGSFPIWGTLYGEWNPGAIAFGFVFGVVASLVATLIPARKAEKLEIADTLKFV